MHVGAWPVTLLCAKATEKLSWGGKFELNAATFGDCARNRALTLATPREPGPEPGPQGSPRAPRKGARAIILRETPSPVAKRCRGRLRPMAPQHLAGEGSHREYAGRLTLRPHRRDSAEDGRRRGAVRARKSPAEVPYDGGRLPPQCGAHSWPPGNLTNL